MLKGLGLGALALGGPASLTGCGAIVAPALVEWFATMTAGIAATVLAESAMEAFREGWEDWRAPTLATMDAQYRAGWGYTSYEIYGHPKPGASMFPCQLSKTSDPGTDRLALAFREGNYVTLESWAWRGVAAFINAESDGKEDDELLHTQQLLASTVLPHGPASGIGATKNKTASWLTYPARDGEVEIVWSKVEDGADTVTVTTTGYFTGQAGNPTLRTYELD